MNDGGYLYELTCVIDPEHEEQYRELMSDAVIQWFGLDGLAGFRPMSEIDGETIQLQFEFTDRQSLDAFVGSTRHREILDSLRSVCTRVETYRWQPGAVSLEGDSSAVVSRPETPPCERVSE